ncbi:MAG: response regulator [Pseudomonadota bacterium]
MDNRQVIQNTKRVLLLDDNPTTLNELRDLLQMCSYSVIAYTNPSLALAKLDNIDFDILITDYKTPDMDGIEFIAKVRKKKPRIVSILCTRTLITHRMVSAMINNVHIDGFLTKPCRLKDIVEVLDAAIERRKAISSNRRRFPRKKGRFPVFFVVNPIYDRDRKERIEVLALDISRGGLSFACKKGKGIDFSTDFDIDLSHLNINRPTTKAQITWISAASQSLYKGGVQFI